MSIKGPSFGKSTPDPSAVPPKPKGTAATNSASFPWKNIALALGGGVVLFIFLVALSSDTENTPPSSTSSSSAPSEVQSSDNQTSPHWGAWAIDTGGGNYLGWSYSSSTEEEAKQLALDSCRQQGAVNCEVLNSFPAGYAAMASGESKWFGVGASASAEEARNDALKGCRNAEKNPNTCTIDKEFNF